MNELLLAIFKDIDAHIYKIVDRRVSEVLANHATLNTINEELEEKMRQIAKDEVYMHEAKQTHHERSDIIEVAHEAMDEYDFSSACGEIVDDRIDSALDDMLHDKIQEILNDTKFVITGGTITTEV